MAGLTTISGGGSFTNANIRDINNNFSYLNASLGATAWNPFGTTWFVNGDIGSDGYDGLSPTHTVNTNRGPRATIQSAVYSAHAGDGVYVAARAMAAGATDPVNYAETIIIPAGTSGLRLIGTGSGLTQGGVPQIKKGSGSTALLTVRAPGCLIANLGFNGASSTGGGILLDDDGSTKTAFGTTIAGCHFKNCKGHATNSTLGGAITWAATGGAWQVRIVGNQFYKNVGGIVLVGTTGSVPEDVVIEGNRFVGTAATVDSYIYLAGGSGMANVLIHDNVFASVLPALGAGSVVRYVDLTGCTGIFSDNYVAGSYTTTGFGAAKAAGKIPTTVGIAHCYSDAGLIVREA